MDLKTNKLLTITFAALLLPLAQGCGPAKYKETSPANSPAHAPLPQDVGEAHGSLVERRATVDSSKTPVGPVAPDVQTPAAQGEGSASAGQIPAASSTDTPDSNIVLSETPIEAPKPAEAPASSARRHMCVDAHKKGYQPPQGLRCPVCTEGSFSQRQVDRPKLDILFVADTSPSLDTERGGIARGIRQFIEALPSDTDYRIAVMPAHSDVSYDTKVRRSTGLAGKLYVAGGEKAVLRVEDYGNTPNNASWTRLTNDLVKKLTRMPMDAATDGGEAGLFSLDKGISEPLLSQNRRQGFFRQDAALAVIFISDENDLCSYGVNYPEGVTPKPNVDKYLQTGLTTEEKANQVYCRDQNGNPTITSRSVFAKLRELQTNSNSPNRAARPLLVSGVLYTSESTVPTVMPPDEKYPKYFSENEVGYGYLDMIRDNEGVPVDISKNNFDEGLRSIGQAAAVKLEVKTEYGLRSGESVDENTICVFADGKEVERVSEFGGNKTGLTYVYKSDLREVHLRGIGRYSKGGPAKVDVFYCEPPDVINFTKETYSWEDIPTRGEHYRGLPVPDACASVRARIQSGQLD